MPLLLRPSVINEALWEQQRPPKRKWEKLRASILARDDFTCLGCGHRAIRHMIVHHAGDSRDHSPSNLATLCVACHAVLHIGRNLALGTIEIWQAEVAQVDIVRQTRAGVQAGRALKEINREFGLRRGPHDPRDIEYANELIFNMGSRVRAYLKEPLCVVFTNFAQWQLE
jgi:hypothetical protein